ncbi:hypothetical protein CCP3SC15_3770002 [Gammaproteobacteria bacterium]
MRALDQVGFSVPQGSITALVGPNGAGKTTLLRCIAGLDLPLSGKIRVDGIDVLDEPRACHRRVGYLSDSFGLYDTLTVRQCLYYAAEANGVDSARLDEAVQDTAAKLGLTDRLRQRTSELSRGLRQRVAIAQAIIHRPGVVLLDEPAAGLDPEARPILLTRNESGPLGQQEKHEAYLSQWQARVGVSESINVAVGREVLNWGPAQFRSLASPFYFDNGRANPMRELSGMDTVKVSWTPNREIAVMLARITGSGHTVQDSWHDSWLLKIEQRDDDWVGGLALARTEKSNGFLGVYGQYTINDALLLYTEASSSVRVDALQSPDDATLPFTLATRSSRRINVLLGAAWTFDNGQTINAEYLHNGHGYRASEERAYFSRAATDPRWAAQALSEAPALLGSDYVHLVWQSNPLESSGYWRAMATHGFTDHGNELSGYAEYAFNGHFSIFGLAVFPIGSVRQEFSSLFQRSVTMGIKAALP